MVVSHKRKIDKTEKLEEDCVVLVMTNYEVIGLISGIKEREGRR